MHIVLKFKNFTKPNYFDEYIKCYENEYHTFGDKKCCLVEFLLETESTLKS